MNRLANKVTEIVGRDYTFVHLMKKSPNFAVAFEKNYNKKRVKIYTVEIENVTMGSSFLIGMSAIAC